MNHLLVKKSANVKTGPIPVTYADRKTCPPSCPHFEDDCYAEGFHTRLAWNRAPTHGKPIEGLAEFIRSMDHGQLWRMNVAGDLPGKGETVDAYELGQIVKANQGRRGFTYTHKKTPDALKWVRHANAFGLTINLSADDAAEADTLADTQAGPVVCIVPMDTPAKSTTPAGRTIVVCPAQLRDEVTCSTCQLCQRADRKTIVGFLAHGNKAKITDARARRTIPIRAA
jgi:hypothetical protein